VLLLLRSLAVISPTAPPPGHRGRQHRSPYGLDTSQLTHCTAAAAMQGIAAGSIVVGGFSQGGCLALLASLSYPRKLAGGVVLSGCESPLPTVI
jgi:predicted esterase